MLLVTQVAQATAQEAFKAYQPAWALAIEMQQNEVVDQVQVAENAPTLNRISLTYL